MDPNECGGAPPAQNQKAARVFSCGEKSDDELFDRTPRVSFVLAPCHRARSIGDPGATALADIPRR